jgi:hypothetical protein
VNSIERKNDDAIIPLAASARDDTDKEFAQTWSVLISSCRFILDFENGVYVRLSSSKPECDMIFR